MTGTLVIFALGLLTGWKYGKRKRDSSKAAPTAAPRQKGSAQTPRDRTQ